jgi:peptidyl-prolyl cis-trans isomerase D
MCYLSGVISVLIAIQTSLPYMIRSLEKFRNTVLGSLFALILAMSMLGFGINLFVGSKSSNAIVVNGEEVPMVEFVRRKNLEEQRFRAMLGSKYQAFAGTLLKNLDQRVADALVQSKLLGQLAKRMGLSGPGDDIVKKKIKESFSQGWSLDAYTRLLSSLGVTALKFQEDFRDELRNTQLRNLINDGALPTTQEVERSIIADYSKYTISTISANTDDFAKGDFRNVNEDTLKSYYEKKENEFRIPAAISYSYLPLRIQDFPNLVKVAEEDVKQYYKQNIERFQNKQTIRFQHIQLTVPKELSPDEKETFKSEVTSLFSKIRDGFSFQRAVALYSDDYATRWNDGKSELFTPDVLIPEFESEVWKHAGDQEPFLITTDYGYHIVEVLDYTPPTPKALKDVSKEIENTLIQESASSFLNEKGQQVYDEWIGSGKSLNDFAQSLNLKTKDTEGLYTIHRDPEPVSEGPSLNGLTLKILEFPEQKTQIIRLDARSVLVEVKEYRKESANTFEQVREEVLDRYVKEVSGDLAKQALQKVLDAIKSGTIPSLSAASLENNLKFEDKIEIGLKSDENQAEYNFPQFLEEIGKFEGKTGVSHAVLPTLQGKFVIFEITKVTPPERELIERKFLDYKEKATQEQSDLIFNTILNYQRAHSSIVIPMNLTNSK